MHPLRGRSEDPAQEAVMQQRRSASASESNVSCIAGAAHVHVTSSSRQYVKCSEHVKDRATNVCVCLMRATALATSTACMGNGAKLVQWSIMALTNYAWLCRCGYTMSTYQSNHENVVQEDKGSFNLVIFTRKS